MHVVVVDVVVMITDMHWSIISTFGDNKEIGSRTPGIIFHYIQDVKTSKRQDDRKKCIFLGLG